MLLLEDSADNVAEHLESFIVRSQRQRSERQIEALGLFNNGQGTLRDCWTAQEDEWIRRGCRSVETELDMGDQQARAGDDFGVQEPYLSNYTVSSRRKLWHEDSDETTEPLEEATGTTRGNRHAKGKGINQEIKSMEMDQQSAGDQVRIPQCSGEDKTLKSKSESSGCPTCPSRGRTLLSATEKPVPRHSSKLAKNTRYAYARATNLIREALCAEAVVCVDAKAAFSNITRPSGDADSSSAASIQSSGECYTGQTSDSESSESSAAAPRFCKVLAISNCNRSSLNGTRCETQEFGLTEKELQRLIRRYPDGKTFDFTEREGLCTSSENESSDEESLGKARSARISKTGQSREARRLGQVMVGARSIGKYPQ